MTFGYHVRGLLDRFPQNQLPDVLWVDVLIDQVFCRAELGVIVLEGQLRNDRVQLISEDPHSLALLVNLKCQNPNKKYLF